MPFQAKSDRDCYQRAAEAHNRAMSVKEPGARDLQLGLERSWAVLGSSYALLARLDKICAQHVAWLQAHQ